MQHIQESHIAIGHILVELGLLHYVVLGQNMFQRQAGRLYLAPRAGPRAQEGSQIGPQREAFTRIPETSPYYLRHICDYKLDSKVAM